jgi:hypothetical protein
MSSVKNFILEDRENNGEKVMLFGKINSDEYVVDVYSPMSMLVGVGVALTVFDTRMGAD